MKRAAMTGLQSSSVPPLRLMKISADYCAVDGWVCQISSGKQIANYYVAPVKGYPYFRLFERHIILMLMCGKVSHENFVELTAAPLFRKSRKWRRMTNFHTEINWVYWNSTIICYNTSCWQFDKLEYDEKSWNIWKLENWRNPIMIK